MDILGWIGWLIYSLFALLWSVVWLLLGGWISTLAQIVVVLMAIFVYRYGWQRAPGELLCQVRALWRFGTGAMKATEAMAAADEDRKRERSRTKALETGARTRSRLPRHRGDVTINLSTALSVAMLAGLWIVSAL
jgi:hypothetical protein